jgi:hypothetical protein
MYPDHAINGESERLDADLAAIEGYFGALDGEELVLERYDGARGAHPERDSER